MTIRDLKEASKLFDVSIVNNHPLHIRITLHQFTAYATYLLMQRLGNEHALTLMLQQAYLRGEQELNIGISNRQDKKL